MQPIRKDDLSSGAPSFARFSKLIATLESQKKHAPFARFLQRQIEQGDANLAYLSDLMLGWAEEFLGEDCYPTLVEGYVAFVMDVNRSQLVYERDGAYANKSYAEAYAAVYGNEAFMKDYHWGVFVTTFAWPHHLEISRIYLERFLRNHVASGPARLVDLGSGSGVWSFLAGTHAPELSIDAIDISETSVRLSQKMRGTLSGFDKMDIHLGDALAWGDDQVGTYDYGVSCFVLEHLETPEKLFENMARLLKPRGVAFMTGALTAAEIDHIYEFKRESEMVRMAEEAGFRVMETASLAAGSYLDTGRFLPRSMALVLSKRAGDIW